MKIRVALSTRGTRPGFPSEKKSEENLTPRERRLGHLKPQNGDLMFFPLDGNGEEWVYLCCSFPMLGVIRFRRSALRLDRASRILVGLVKNGKNSNCEQRLRSRGLTDSPHVARPTPAEPMRHHPAGLAPERAARALEVRITERWIRDKPACRHTRFEIKGKLHA